MEVKIHFIIIEIFIGFFVDFKFKLKNKLDDHRRSKMERSVKVVIWGFGAMGSGMAEMLLKKKGVEIPYTHLISHSYTKLYIKNEN